MAFVNCLIPIGKKAFNGGVQNVCINKTSFHSTIKVGPLRSRGRNLISIPMKNEKGRLRMEVSVGSDIPVFSLLTNGGGTLSSDDLKTGATILYFYPRDATPGCTTEAQDFRDLMGELKEMNVNVVGVSKDSVESHDKFVKDQQIPFPLVSDDGTLTEGFGVWKLLKRGDIEKMGVQRSTFIIKDGKIVKEWRGIKAGGHAAEVFEAVKQI